MSLRSPQDCGGTTYIPFSDDKHRFVKKFNPHVQTVTGSGDVIVTQLLRYHMPLLYCMQPFNFMIVYWYKYFVLCTEMNEVSNLQWQMLSLGLDDRN